jgi:GNAT superfamily N-acetyltransferase
MTDFHLRPMQLEDSQAISDITEQGDGMMTTYFQIEAYRAMIDFAELDTVGVVAEADGFDGLAGIATLRTGTCQFNDALLPFVILDSLKVDEQFRKQGLGTQLAQWRVEYARQQFGDDVVLLSGTSTDNIASQNTMKKWCQEFTDPIPFNLLRTTSRKPNDVQGITIRDVQPDEYEAFAHTQNTFYKDYNLYIPVSEKRLTKDVANSPVNQPIIRHIVAVTDDGNLVAGVSARYRGDLMIDKISPPTPLRIANIFLRLLPPDGILRDVTLRGLWYADGQDTHAQYLLDMMRYLYHDKTNTIGFIVDTRSPLAALVKRNRFLPLPKLIYSIKGPTLLERDRLIYSFGRS